MKFEWDQNKADSNVDKHSVNFSEATTVFSDPLELTILDPDHSTEEYRFISVGLSKAGNILLVSYTEIEDGNIRIISARKATRQEQIYYEQKH